MNYTELTAAIVTYTEGNGVSAFDATDIATFVRQAEKRIYNQVQVLAAQRSQQGNFTSSNKFLTIPVDCLSIYEVSIIANGEYDFLLPKDLSFIKAAYPNSSAIGIPRYYAWFDQNTLMVGPTPDSGYSVEMKYYYYPESIVTAGTTWLGDNFDQVLLAASVYEAAVHMKEEDALLAKYKERMDSAIAELKQFAEGKQRQDMYRTPQVRYPVR